MSKKRLQRKTRFVWNEQVSKKLGVVLSGLIVVGLALVLAWPFYHPWFPQAMDAEYYLSRLGNYYVALEQGQMPPRWAPTFRFGFGYPVFNYNYPLPNMVGVSLMALGFTAQTSMKLLFVGLMISGGLGVLFWLRRSFGQGIALAGSVMFMTAPFQIYDLFARATIGEYMAVSMLPWVLLRLEQVMDQKKSRLWVSCLVFGMFLIAHNIVVAMSAVVLPLFALMRSREWKKLKRLVMPWMISLMLASFFWIPALMEMNYSQVSMSPINNKIEQGFRNLRELTKLPYVYEPNDIDPLNEFEQFGYAQLMVVVVSAVIVMSDLRDKKRRVSKEMVFWLMVVFGCVFLISPLSAPVRRIIKILRFWQHPFRLLLMTVVATTGLVGGLMNKLRWRWLMVVLLLLAGFNYYRFMQRPAYYLPYSDEFLKNYPLSSAAADEFDTIWFDPEEASEFADRYEWEKVMNLPEGSRVRIDFWNGTQRRYEVDVENEAQVVESTMYFPGWETRIDGKKIDLWQYRKQFYGLLNFPVRAGRHVIETRFTQNTWARWLGNGLTMVGLVVLVVVEFELYKPVVRLVKDGKTKK